MRHKPAKLTDTVSVNKFNTTHQREAKSHTCTHMLTYRQILLDQPARFSIPGNSCMRHARLQAFTFSLGDFQGSSCVTINVPVDIPESLAYAISPPSKICRRDLKLLVFLAIDFECSTLANCHMPYCRDNNT